MSIPRMQPQMPTRGEGGVFSPPSRAGAKHDDHKGPNGEPAADGLGGGVNSNNSNAAHVHSGYADEMEINQRAVNVGNELDGAAGLGIKKTVGAGIDGSLRDITTDQAILERSFNGWASLLATIKKKDRLEIVESQGVKQGIFGNFIDRMGTSMRTRNHPAGVVGLSGVEDANDDDHADGKLLGANEAITNSMSSFNQIEQEETQESEPLPFGVLNPSGNFRLLLELLGAIFIAFDFFTIPVIFAFWDRVEEPWQTRMITLMFWSMESCLGFTTSFFRRGELVTSRKAVAWNYFKTWFIIDVLTVGFEWTEIVTRLLLQAASLRDLPWDVLRFIRILGCK